MFRVELVAHSDDLDNSLGFFILGTERNERIYACRESRLLAHDIVEHSPAPQGTATDELMALGGVFYGRYNYVNMDLKGDIQFCWDDARAFSEELLDIERPKCDVIDEFIELVDEASFDESEPICDETKRLTVNLLAQGYNAAKVRFPNPLDMMETFKAIERLWLPKPDFEGQRFTIQHDRDNAIITEIYDD